MLILRGDVGQILHSSTTTTHAIRAAIQRSKAHLEGLAVRYGLNRKTVALEAIAQRLAFRLDHGDQSAGRLRRHPAWLENHVTL